MTISRMSFGAVAIGAVLATGLASSTHASSGAFGFDPDGSGPLPAITNANAFVILLANGLSVGGNQAVENFVTNDLTGSSLPVAFQTFVQGRVGAITDNSTTATNVAPAGLDTDFEITIVAGITEEVTNAAIFPSGTTFAEFATLSSGVNFFELYYDDTPDADDLAGTGFNDGVKIMGGTINPGGDSFIVLTGGGAGTDLDQFGSDDYTGIDTVTGSGTTDIQVTMDNTMIDTDFFTFTDVTGINLGSLFASQRLPYELTNPSALFTGLPGGVLPAVVGASGGGTVDVSIGEVNGDTTSAFKTAFGYGLGLGGPDVMFQVNGQATFDLTQAYPNPEPVTGALSAMGLGALSLASRRRRFARSTT